MLGTFPKDFSQLETTQGYFSKWQLSKYAISQAVTSQVCPSCSTWPSACSSCITHPIKPKQFAPIDACGASECLTYPMESCCLGNCTFGKLPLGKYSVAKLPMGKYQWEST